MIKISENFIKDFAEKKKEIKPLTKAKATSIVKKCKIQLEGIKLAEEILSSIVLEGLQTLNTENEKLYLTQIKELGNYYISGIQALFSELITMCKDYIENESFTECIELINYIFAVLKKSKVYLNEKMKDYEDFPNIGTKSNEMKLKSRIEEQIGFAWKLEELEEVGLVKENAKLIQVAFNVYEDNAKKQFIDLGIWIEVETGTIYKTFNYRSFKSKTIKPEDSVFKVLTIPKLYIYPSEINSRIRWESEISEQIKYNDLDKITGYASNNFLEVIKEVKFIIKNPVSTKSPVYLLKVSNILEDDNGNMAIFDRAGNGIPIILRDFGFIIKHLCKEQIINSSMVCEFEQDIYNGILRTVPIAIINESEIIRLQY